MPVQPVDRLVDQRDASDENELGLGQNHLARRIGRVARLRPALEDRERADLRDLVESVEMSDDGHALSGNTREHRGKGVRAGLVDRLMLYRAPILIGAGKACLGDIGLDSLNDAHGRWQISDSRRLGNDRVEVYDALK